MKTLTAYLCWAIGAGSILYVALAPQGLEQSPTTGLCLGMIGLGVAMEMKQRTAKACPAKQEA